MLERNAGASLLVVLIGLLFSGSSTFSAVGELDQSFWRDSHVYNLGALVGEGFTYVGQTAQTGISGRLVAAELNIYRQSSSNQSWEISVQRVVVGGLPTGQVLASEILSAADIPSVPGTALPAPVITFDPAPSFLAGEPFALIARLVGPTVIAGGWSGHTGIDEYPFGGIAMSHNGSDFSLGPAGQDLFFRTYVDPVPEPGIGLAPLLVSGGIYLLQRKQPSRR